MEFFRYFFYLSSSSSSSIYYSENNDPIHIQFTVILIFDCEFFFFFFVSFHKRKKAKNEKKTKIKTNAYVKRGKKIILMSTTKYEMNGQLLFLFFQYKTKQNKINQVTTIIIVNY